jgi:hypothetical protein
MIPALKTLLKVLVFLLLYGNAGASEPLAIVYPQEEIDDEMDSSASPYFIDNQSYLKEYQKRSTGAAASPVTIITINGSSCPSPRGGFRGFEYNHGTTMLRYYEGYPINCRRHFYSVKPRRRPPPEKEPRHRRRP